MLRGLSKARKSLGMGWQDAEIEKRTQDYEDMLAEMDQAGWLVIRGVGDVYSPSDRVGALCIERVAGGFNVFGKAALHLTDDQAFALLEWIAAHFGMEVLRDVVPNAETQRRMRELVARAVEAKP